MEQFTNFIIEKLHLTKHIKGTTQIDPSDAEMIYDIIRAIFIALHKQYFEGDKLYNVFKIKGIAQYTIRKSEVDYELIINVLNDEYEYNFDVDEVKNKKSVLWNVIHDLLPAVENLINMKREVSIPGIKSKYIRPLKQPINGIDIYWNDWKPYAKKHNIKS